MSNSDPGLLRAEVPQGLAGKRFDRALLELFDGLSGAELQRCVRRGRVKVDGEKIFRSNFKLRGGENISVRIAPPPALRPLPLELLHEEASFVVVNKPPGMLVHGNEKQQGGTVSDLAVERFGALPSVEGDARPGIVHRLDRETSGVMVIARTRTALKELRRQFMQREVRKTYLALVHSQPVDDEFKIDLALGPVPGEIDLQGIDSNGKAAQTAFRVVQRFGAHALVECRPTTGRRHQIRVNLVHVGCCVVGDKLYGRAAGLKIQKGAKHHMLHAQSLEFHDPDQGRRVIFEAVPPTSFLDMQDALEGRP